MKPRVDNHTSVSALALYEDKLPIFLTVDEAASLLRTTPAAIYTMIERGLLAGVTRVRRRVLIRTADLLDSLTPEVHAIAERL